MHNQKGSIGFTVSYNSSGPITRVLTHITAFGTREETCAPVHGTLQSQVKSTADGFSNAASRVSLLPPASLNQSLGTHEVDIRGAASHPSIDLRKKNAAKDVWGMERSG
jgi:hypothetical protein